LLGAVHALRFGDPAGAVRSTPARSPVAVVVAGATTPRVATTVAASGPARTAAPPLGLRFGLIAGMYSEKWEGAIAGLLEAQAGLRFSWRARWSLALAGGLGRGLETADGVRARTTRALVSVGYLVGAHLEVRVGAEWRSLAPERTDVTLAAPRAATPGTFLSTRYMTSGGRFRLALGPQLGLAAAPIAVTLADRELFRVPQLLVGFSLAVESDLIR
jgi:hypothetical protein